MPWAYNEFQFRLWPQYVGEGAGWGIVYIRHWSRGCDFVKGVGPALMAASRFFTKPDQPFATKLSAAGTGFDTHFYYCAADSREDNGIKRSSRPSHMWKRHEIL